MKVINNLLRIALLIAFFSGLDSAQTDSSIVEKHPLLGDKDI